MNCVKNIVFVFLILGACKLYAQETTKEEKVQPNKASKHSINLELCGHAFAIASMNYEYLLRRQISFGVGLGFHRFTKIKSSRFQNGQEEIGKFFSISTSQMLYGNYFIGKNKHKLFFTGGLTNFLYLMRNKYPSETFHYNSATLVWNAGVGYQYLGKVMYYRLTGYCFGFKEETEFMPKYMPWLGITMGVKL